MAASFQDKQDQSPHSFLYLHPNENPATALVSPVLDASNYHSWSRRSMLTALSAKNKIEFFLSTAVQPAKNNSAFGSWFRCNNIVVSWLVRSASISIQ